jgi:hypothetical protein
MKGIKKLILEIRGYHLNKIYEENKRRMKDSDEIMRNIEKWFW